MHQFQGSLTYFWPKCPRNFSGFLILASICLILSSIFTFVFCKSAMSFFEFVFDSFFSVFYNRLFLLHLRYILFFLHPKCCRFYDGKYHLQCTKHKRFGSVGRYVFEVSYICYLASSNLQPLAFFLQAIELLSHSRIISSESFDS